MCALALVGLSLLWWFIGDRGVAKERTADVERPRAPVLSFAQMCDASGGLFLSEYELAVADDESNVIRVYDVRRGGTPTRAIDLAGRITDYGKKREREADLEAVARVSDLTFWIGSHGRSKKGKLKPERQVLFATRGGVATTVEGVYRTLLDDLARDARYSAVALAQRGGYGPEHPDGVNVEGLATRRQGGVWIAFRNPRPRGRALLAALENPADVVAGAEPRFGAPALLELGGRGIRDVASLPNGYLIAAGMDEDSSSHKLYQWDGTDQAMPLAHDVTWLNVEALAVTPSGRVLLLSDDGQRQQGSVECKRAPESLRSFRAVWLDELR